MKKTLILFLFLPLLLPSMGCYIFYPNRASNPRNHYKKIRRIAVAPFFDMTGNENLQRTDDGYSGLRVAKIFCDEMVQFKGFEVVRAQIVAQAILKNKMTWKPGRLGIR